MLIQPYQRRIAGVVLLALGFLALVPRRNAWGNPFDERQLTECTLSDGATVRVYEGEPDATVGAWYSVTYDAPRLGIERQIVFSYAAPAFTRITCNARGLQLDGPDAGSHVFLSTEEASSLRWHPRKYERGHEVGSDRRAPIAIWQLFGVGLLALGAIVLRGSREQETRFSSREC